VSIDPEFAAAVINHPGPHKVFYSAFGGCHGDVLASVEVVGRKEILAWAETERGAMYRRFLVGE
jgi:hypothetical protein